VRRYLFAFIGLAVLGAASAVLYSAFDTDRNYARLIALGDQSATGDQPFQALEAYSGAIAMKPESMLAHLKRGRLYRERGELDAAAKDLRRAVELDSTATLPLELLGDTYLSLERHARAAERYQAYLALDDRSPQVWYKLGLALYRDRRAEAAITPLQRSIRLDRDIAEAHLLLGLCLRELGDVGRARASLETAARLSPALTAPREALATVYADAGELSRAIDQLEALAALDSTRADRFVALGLAYARARRYEAAVLTLNRAVERFPDDPRVYGALGRVWLEAADTRSDVIALQKASEALQTAAVHPEVSSDTLTDFARVLIKAGDLSGAERALREATTKRPLQPDAYLHLATLAAGAARLREARDALVRYAVLVGDTKPVTSVATQIADYSLRLGDTPIALRWIARAVDETGETPALSELRRRAAAASVP
jgi:superkiller protein 3